MKQGFLTLALLFFSTILFADNFSGLYKCKGHDPYLNKDYTGTVRISPQNTVYKLDMRYDTGQNFDGTGGLFNSNLLSVVFQDRKNLKQVGLERYQFSIDKTKIGGLWVLLGQDKLGTEICVKQK